MDWRVWSGSALLGKRRGGVSHKCEVAVGGDDLPMSVCEVAIKGVAAHDAVGRHGGEVGEAFFWVFVDAEVFLIR